MPNPTSILIPISFPVNSSFTLRRYALHHPPRPRPRDRKNAHDPGSECHPSNVITKRCSIARHQQPSEWDQLTMGRILKSVSTYTTSPNRSTRVRRKLSLHFSSRVEHYYHRQDNYKVHSPIAQQVRSLRAG